MINLCYYTEFYQVLSNKKVKNRKRNEYECRSIVSTLTCIVLFPMMMQLRIYLFLLFSCTTDSDMDGNESIRCQDNGEWTKPPTCLKRCYFPHIKYSNTSSDITEFKANSKVDVYCIDKANIIGSNEMTCLNGSWLNIPTCKVYRCDKPILGLNDNIIPNAIYTVNTTYYISCDEGYSGNANLTAVCDQEGEWSVDGSCGIEKCGLAPHVKFSSNNGSAQPDRIYTYQESVVYR